MANAAYYNLKYTFGHSLKIDWKELTWDSPISWSQLRLRFLWLGSTSYETSKPISLRRGQVFPIIFNRSESVVSTFDKEVNANVVPNQ